MKITLLHPSRNRAIKAYSTYKSWINNSSKTIEINHILCLDTDDYDIPNYRTYFPGSDFVIAENKSMVEAVNRGAKEATGEILVLLSDDFECFPDWDIEIVKVYEANQHFTGDSDWVLKTSDGCEGWIVTLPIMGIDYYKKQGYIYHPDCVHLFPDTIQTHKAELEGCLIVRNDLVFKHRHPMYDKSVPIDHVYKKSNSTWEQGKQVYLKEVRNKFGLGEDTDVFKLSPIANAHIEWLKKELAKC